MSIHKLILSFTLIIVISNGQSVYNSHGLGIMKSSFFSSSDGAGSIGLVPTFTPKVSLNNPSTWSNLNFSYVNTSYFAHSVKFKDASNSSFSSQFSGIQFLIPIRKKYGVAFSVKPTNNHNSFISTDTSRFQMFDEYLETFKEFRSGGGLMASNFAFSAPINSQMNVGVSYYYFFGSSRNEKSVILNSTYYRSLNINTYKGSKYDIYFSGKMFDSNNLSINIYSKIGKSLDPISGYSYNFDFFEDTDNNYVPSSNDFPLDTDVDTVRFESAYAPNDFSLGMNIDLKNSVNVFSEFELWSDNAESSDFFSLNNDQIQSKSHLGFGLVKFGNREARDWQDKITMRMGIYRKNYSYLSSKKLIENGMSLGFGIKFSSTGNQLDVSYKRGTRSSEDYFNEIFNEITFGISIGDVWFLRRRAKQ